ncbi:MAG: glycosyl hydrolase [Planctomycetia bacterium]|nr:glycosyl hydrolase [Planctomycetia bacterium]
MKKILFFLFLLSSLFLSADLFASVKKETKLSKEEFASIPMEYRPWVYYWWLKGNITEEQITRDLQEMQQKGVGGVLLFDSRRYHEDPERHIPVPLEIENEFMSPSWRKLAGHLIREADRLGLKVSMNISDTGGHLRGPWDFTSDGPRELIWTETNVNGPKKFSSTLPLFISSAHSNESAPYYREVALIAVRLAVPKAPGREEGKMNESWGTVRTPSEQAPVVEEIVDLAPFVKNKKIEWNVPEGAWRILRFGNRVIGDYGSIDILNKDIVKKYFDLFGTRMIKESGPLAGKSLVSFYNVSWEGSSPNWTDGFEDFFKQNRGYDIRKYLPVLRGLIVGDRAESERFIADFNKTIADAFCINCYRTIGELCHQNGLVWHSEDGGPWMRSAPMFAEADMLSFWGQNDIPQGEFWVHSANKHSTRSNMRYAAMAGHIYGSPAISAEAFTHMFWHWTMYPGWLKPGADINLIDGTNMFIWHTFTASPPQAGKPGYEYFAGTHVNTNVTWWNMAGGIMNYLGRCQYLLRQGLFAADLCVYASDKNYFGWGRGEKWNPKSNLVPEKGFTYDLLDTNVLVNRMKFEKGRFVLPDGMSYKILVLDPIEKELPVSALEKIKSMISEGGIVVLGKNIPDKARGLRDYPKGDQEVQKLANAIWGDGSKKVHSLGKGKIYRDTSIAEVLKKELGNPDFEGPFEYHHRLFNGQDVYFVSGAGRADCLFRVSGKKPELWDAVSGKVRPAENYSFTSDGRTKITLDLPEDGSVFVVFNGSPDKKHFVEGNAKAGSFEFLGQNGENLDLIQWKSGKFAFSDNLGNKTEMNTDLPDPITLDGPWKVSFDPKWGGPEKTVFKNLSLWNENADPGIKFYSGTAVYRKEFTLDPAMVKNRIRLDLGKVFNIARVRLNGQDLGVIWTQPWSVDLNPAIQPGKNFLEIEVVNCWANRLIGDAALDPDQRLTKTNLHLYKKSEQKRNFQGFSEAHPLYPSGLLGPVQIQFGQEYSVNFQ